jgi:4-alpha-glucanotransferase
LANHCGLAITGSWVLTLSKGAIPMTYLNDEFWVADIKIDKEEASSFHYKYILRHEDGEIVPEFGKDRLIEVPKHGIKEVQLIDTWNHAGEYENAFYSTPFADILLKRPASKSSGKVLKVNSLIFLR